MENIGYANLLAGTYSHPILRDLVVGLVCTGMVLNFGVIVLSIYKIGKRDKTKDPLRGYVQPILAGVIAFFGYSIYFMNKHGEGFYPVVFAYRALVWLSAISVFGSIATALNTSSRSITIGHVAVYMGYLMLTINVICGIAFQKMPINYSNIINGKFTYEELRRYNDLAQYITNGNWVFLALFLFLFSRYYTHFKVNGLLTGIIVYIVISTVALITDTATVYSDTRYASVSGIKALLVVNFILVDVINVVQMIMSVMLCKQWVVGKSLPNISGSEIETARDNQTQMSNPFEG